MNSDSPTAIGRKHWFRSAESSSSAIHVNGIGLHERMTSGHVNRPYGTDDWLFMVFWDGSDLLSAKGDSPDSARFYDGPVAMLWQPHDYHYYGLLNGEWNHSWLHITGTTIDREWENSNIPTNTPFPLTDGDRIEKILTLLVEECQHPSNPSVDILTNGFRILISELTRQYQSPNNNTPRPSWLQHCLDHIAQHYDQPLTLAEAAQRASLSVPRFCALFKQHTGSTLIQTLWKTRMEAALYQLGDHNRSITEVAAMVGVPDIFQFSKQFKRYHGKSPRAWRQSNTQ